MDKQLFAEYSDEQRDKLMDDVLGAIQALCPEIPIIEV